MIYVIQSSIRITADSVLFIAEVYIVTNAVNVQCFYQTKMYGEFVPKGNANTYSLMLWLHTIVLEM